MSIIYSVECSIRAEFTQTNISKVFIKGSQLGFIYFNTIEFNNFFDSPIIDPEEAAFKLFSFQNESIENDFPTILTKYEDTYFYIFISKISDNKISIDFNTIGYPWKKEFWNSDNVTRIDFARYIKKMLQICDGFAIIKLQTFEQ